MKFSGLTNKAHALSSVAAAMFCAAGLLPASAAQAASILTVQFNNDAKTVSYQLDYDISGASNPNVERQIYLDSDQLYGSGFKTAGIGADYALINGYLYRHSGTNGGWGWTQLKKVSYNDDGKRANWTVALADLLAPGMNSPSQITGLKVFAALGSGTAYAPSALNQTLGAPAALARNPLLQPFASTSIWNMPVGSNAQYVPAGLVAVPGNDPWAPLAAPDYERIVLTPDAPATPILYNNVGWNGGDRCTPTNNTVLDVATIPRDYVVGNSRYNNGAVFLRTDGRTLVQTQPFTRCAVDASPTSIVAFAPVDLYGAGILGGHGGSGLSTLGGTLRVGELRPLPSGNDPYQGVRHALKFNLDSREALYACTTLKDCYTWPAVAADAGAVGYYGSKPGATPAPKEMKMGALLALPANLDIRSLGLQTAAAKQLAWTLQNYGAYVVDSTGGPGYGFAVEEGLNGSFENQFKADWGFDFAPRVRDNSPWGQDLQTLITRLQVVANNGSQSIGGGGTPLQALLPALPF